MTRKKTKSPRVTLAVVADACTHNARTIEELARVAEECDSILGGKVDELVERVDDVSDSVKGGESAINQLRSELQRLHDSHAHTRQAVSRLAVQLHQTLQTANGANIRVSMLRDDFEAHCRDEHGPSAWSRLKGWFNEKLDWGFGGGL